MIHPLFTRLVTQPGLFAEHAGAYAQLAVAEAQQLGMRWKRQVVLAVVAGLCGLIGLALAGMALLLAAAVPAESMPAAWALWVVPAVPLVAAGGAVVAMWRMQSQQVFALLRGQFAEDARLLAEVAS